MKLSKLRVAVLGLGLSGRAAVRFLLKRGASVTGIDGNRDHLANHPDMALFRAEGCALVHEEEVKDLKSQDLLVVSPGVPPHHRIWQLAREANLPIIGEVELAFREIAIPCIGVTGTNGKTTVTLLITHVLNSCGHKALALGNVGVALTDAVDTLEQEKCAYAVVELSSFQIDTMQEPCLDSAILLNITPDHLDRYQTMDAYARSKAHITDLLVEGGAFYLEQAAFEQYRPLFAQIDPILYGYDPSCSVVAKEGVITIDGKSQLKLPSTYGTRRSHDVENIMAAFAVCHRYGVTGEQFIKALETFQKPKHRIEFVTVDSGVRYYDDSKGTNIDAVIRAVETVQGPIVLIAGGVDKGAPYLPWISAFAGKVKAVCAIGQASPMIKRDLEPHVPVSVYTTLEEAVDAAKKNANAGDAILLSPGCASYDMFKDYAHRGEEFQRIVHSKTSLKRGDS